MIYDMIDPHGLKLLPLGLRENRMTLKDILPLGYRGTLRNLKNERRFTKKVL